MKTPADWPADVATALSALTEGHAFSVPDNLFAKIDDELRDGWQAQFAGSGT